MKNKTILHTVFYISLLVVAFLISFIKIENYSYQITNNLIVIIVDIVLSLSLFVLFEFIRNKISYECEKVMYWLWTLFILGIYFFIGYLLTGNLLVKKQSHILNLSSVSLSSVIGIILWFLFFFSKGSSSGGWITIKNMEWTIYLVLFPYSLPLVDSVDNKRIKQLLVFVPILPSVLIWLGMELKR